MSYHFVMQITEQKERIRTLEEELRQVKESLAHERVLFSNYIHDTSEGIHCLPECGAPQHAGDHAPSCLAVDPVLAWHELQRKLKLVTEALVRIKNATVDYQAEEVAEAALREMENG